MGSIEIKYGDKTDIHSLEALGESSGGGQPLYRHTIKVYDGWADRFEVFIQLTSTSSEVVDTEEKLKVILGNEDIRCICSGQILDESSLERFPVGCIRVVDGVYWIESLIDLEHIRMPLFPDNRDTVISDTVTEIGTASVSGGGDCQIVEIPSQGHAEAQTTILDLLKPDSVPTGKYLYSYYTDGCERNNATIAICYKNSEKITGTQLTSDGDVRKFWYYFESEEEGNECFQPLGGHRLYRHSLTIDYSANDCEGLICLDFISTCENKFDYATLRNHISTDQMASGFHKDANGVCYPIVKLYKDLYDIYVCPLYSNSLGENTVSESMIGEIYDKITPVDEYRLM